MYSYIRGMIKEIESTYVTLDNNGVGYKIFTPNPYAFQLDNEYTIYIYQYIREDEISLYGFKTFDERKLFLKLIDVKGLGPKMALPIIAMGSISGISDAINRENVLYLKKFPKIGDKLAKQMILDLKGKLDIEIIEDQPDMLDELMEVLKGLGYKDKEIKSVIPQVNHELKIEDLVKGALKLLVR